MSMNISSHTQPVVGVIAEYNPFHNGHAFHIQEAKRLCNASYCGVVMSGDFVQRGAPAIFDKYARAFMALSSGADLVVEMPPAFALASAEDFAFCGVSLLESLGVVTHLCFGSECGHVAPLMDLARILACEPWPFVQALRREVASGLSYPKARQKALAQYLASCRTPGSTDQSTASRQTHEKAGQASPSCQTPESLEQAPLCCQTHGSLEQAPPFCQTHENLEQAPPSCQAHENLEQTPPSCQAHENLEQAPPSRQTHESPESLLSSPNNTLGVEYLKALIKQGSSIVPVTIARQGAGYHEENLTAGYSSATAIRKIIYEQNRQTETPLSPHAPGAFDSGALSAVLGPLLPYSCMETIRTCVPVSANDFSLLLSCRLLELSRQGAGLEQFADVSPDLALRIARHTLRFSSFEERAAALKTRQYTYTRISRCLMHILLGITRKDIDSRKRLGYGSYIRILGFRRDSAPLLGNIKRRAWLPLVTKTADARKILSPQTLEHFDHDLFCSHLYQSVVCHKSHTLPKNEYTRSLIIV